MLDDGDGCGNGIQGGFVVMLCLIHMCKASVGGGFLFSLTEIVGKGASLLVELFCFRTDAAGLLMDRGICERCVHLQCRESEFVGEIRGV